MKKRFFVAALALIFALALLPSLALADGNIAEVNGIGYETLDAALSAIQAEGSSGTANVKLLSDITFPSEYSLSIQEGTTVVLDLNGCKLVGTNAGSFIKNYGNLTINDSSAANGSHGVGNGLVYTTDIADQGRAAVTNYGTLTINAGIFGDKNTDMTDANDVQRGNAVRNYGYAVINGGAFTACDNYIKGGYAYSITNGGTSYPDAVMVVNYATAYGNTNGILAADGGTLIVKDGSYILGNGTVSNLYRIAYTSGNGVVNIEGGEYERRVANSNGFFGGVINVSGGNFVDDTCSSGIVIDRGKVNIDGGTFNNALKVNTSVPVVITGGTFSSDVSDYVSGAATGSSVDGKFEVKLNGSEGAVASVVRGRDTLYYTYLAEAVDEIRRGETITLLNDITLDSTLTIDTGAAFTIDLNGHDIEATERVIMVERGNVSFTGEGTIEETSPNYGAINIKGSADSGDVNYTTVTVGKDVTLVAWAPVFITPNESSGAPYAYGVTVNIEGTLISKPDTSGSNGHGIYINGQIQHLNNAPVINVSGASVTSEGDGIYAAGYATWNIVDSYVSGYGMGIGIKAGELNISGDSVIRCTGPNEAPTDGFSNGINASGAAIQIESNDDYAGNIAIDIEGGQIISDNGYSIYEYANGDDSLRLDKLDITGGSFQGAFMVSEALYESKAKVIDITGGSYDSSVAEYVSDSMKYELNNGGIYTYYTNLNDALDAAEDGAVISDLGEGASTVFYRLAVSYGNGQSGIDVKLPAGTEYKLPAAPSKVGYIFMGWKCSDGHTYQANETVTVEKDMTFTAVWSALPDIEPGQPSQPDEPDVPDFPFTDVSVNAWYYEAVKYVYENGIMNGMDRYSFQPNGTLTRAMIWTMLARLDGVDTEGGNSWYAKAQEWATATGVSDGENPTGEVTREQLVTMLWRYAGSPVYTADLSGYVDTADISSWAQQAMCWAVATGVIEGDENAALTPKADTTRAQAAAMLMRSIEA